MATKSRQLDAENRNKLPDSTFAFPRVRKEPLSDARHVRNAIARFDQVEDVSDTERDEAFRRIKRAAKKYDVELTEKNWHELGKPKAPASAAKSRSTTSSTKSKSSASPEKSKAELYAEAKRRHIDGRSSMTKAELQRALAK